MLNLQNNYFSERNKVKPFTQKEISSIISRITDLSTDPEKNRDLKLFLKSKLTPEIIDEILSYLEALDKFLKKIDFSSSEINSDFKDDYTVLYNDLLVELDNIQTNYSSLVSNTRSLKKIKNQIEYYDKFFNFTEKISVLISGMKKKLKDHLSRQIPEHHNKVSLWIETTKIKKSTFKYSEQAYGFSNWKEFEDLRLFIENLSDQKSKVSLKNKRKSQFILFSMNSLIDEIESNKKASSSLYFELLHILHSHNVIKEEENGEFVNVVVRKKIQRNIDDFLELLLREKSTSLFSEFLTNEIGVNVDQKTLNKYQNELNKTFKLDLYLWFPEISNIFFEKLDDLFYSITKSTDTETEPVEVITKIYSYLDSFTSIFQKIEFWFQSIEKFFLPFNNTIKKFKLIISNVVSEIERRKHEYQNYIKTMQDEELRLEVRKFVDSKISELNNILTNYEAETSVIIKRELPQLKQITKILKAFKTQIQKIKSDVHAKLVLYQKENIDLYQIIRKWEKNFSQKRQQMSFLIRLLLNKLFKSFKDLLEEEGFLFATITEISEHIDNFEDLPLNFAVSEFLAEKLSEDELRERILEIKSKLGQLNKSLGLYQMELTKLEKILETKVKIKNGISDSKIQCTICHDNINFIKDNVISCPFCASTYHYLCVASWLSNHNSCPHCQNSFLNPNSELFENRVNE